MSSGVNDRGQTHGRRLAAGQRASAVGAIDKCDIAWSGIPQRGGALNCKIDRSHCLTVHQEGQFAERREHDGFLSLRSRFERKSRAAAMLQASGSLPQIWCSRQEHL